jgi:hypothetical protein
MTNQTMATAIRGVLAQYAVSNALINGVITTQLKEQDVAEHLAIAVNTMLVSKLGFAAALDLAMVGLGAVWGGATYNLAALNLTPGVRMAATEELSAIRTHAPTAGYDAAKALTNMLRLIKAAERPGAY